MAGALDWERLLSPVRFRLNPDGALLPYTIEETVPRTPAEADVQRLVFSAPFRRLAGKTQVHPFARVDYVHNRLTHSLEVAETGAGLARTLALRLGLDDATTQACVLHVRAACLGHDIGNPPYGHAGEFAIRHWVHAHREDLHGLLSQDGEDASVLGDLEKFDGNAQTFRLLSHPKPRDGAHFRLTCATLGALIKYPRRACDTGTAKFSCFRLDEPVFDAVMSELGLRRGPHAWERHPLSYLTEIADDMCYCVTDCEDALLMGILDEATVRGWYRRLFSPAARSIADKPSLSIGALRAFLIGDLMHCFADELTEAFRHPETLADFERQSPVWQRLKVLKQDYAVVFEDPSKLRVEIRAQTELGKTLDCFLKTVRTLRGTLDYDDRCLIRYTFGEAFVQTHRDRPYGWWLHTMLDFVTGMTDAFLHTFADIL